MQQLYSAAIVINQMLFLQEYLLSPVPRSIMEYVRGSIEIGKVADFQVLSDDIFKADKEKIGDIQVEMTIVDGKIVYSAQLTYMQSAGNSYLYSGTVRRMPGEK